MFKLKITIDTKEDSHDDIRRIIKMLSSLVGQEEVMSNQGDLFSDDSSLGVDTTEPKSTPSTSPSLSN
ncbi:MAG: hypothetical protein IIB83_05305 [Bacteroidetes bacterium]|nr:hypothetical protein [Bacteroidota bacterium]